MKLQFEPSITYQKEAVDSVTSLFNGQTPVSSIFSVTSSMANIGMDFMDNGLGNRLELTHDRIFANLREVQTRNGLPISSSLKSYDFNIEMETGTGKTYVYIRSMLELHEKYGFSKFIIVVPSLAIKEGVYKTLQITKEHFGHLYDNVVYDYFVYDSNQLDKVRGFAVADHLSIMVINIDAFRKSFIDPSQESKANIIHRASDRMNGMRPIDLIKETNPIVIIDEPQSVDTTPKSAEAIRSLNPLVTFRYSATHVKKYPLIYRLNAIDAFDLKIVKGIEVASFESQDYHNKAYMRLVSVDNRKSPIKARIEIDVQDRNGVKRKAITVKSGDDLYEKSGGREVYESFIIDEINCVPQEEYVSFSTRGEVLRLGQIVGDIDDLSIKESQIRATIREHLEKMLLLKPLGIKVLSLFFIDKVKNYRGYDQDGNPRKGIYALMFERLFTQIANAPKYRTLFEGKDIAAMADTVHNGYFAVDKKGKIKDTNGSTADDESAYNLIMKDKEKLLSFDEKLSFIFSHSALREGWDNPNVFQICTLNETNSEVKKRQEIGRGLRLCVNQQGTRLYDPSLNILTVMANESYDSFTRNLQNEYEENGIRFGVFEKHSFSSVRYQLPDGQEMLLGEKISEAIYQNCYEKKFVDQHGSIQTTLVDALKGNQKYEFPQEIHEMVLEDIKTKYQMQDLPFSSSEADELQTALSEQVTHRMRRLFRGLPIQKRENKVVAKFKKEAFIDQGFLTLWNQIKYKTTYRVNFDSEKLIEQCIEELQRTLIVNIGRVVMTKAGLTVGRGGINAQEIDTKIDVQKAYNEQLPDVVAFLQNATSLTRRTIVKILIGSGKLNLFKKNPQKFMEETARIIRKVMQSYIVDGIKYTKIGPESYYTQELFESQELVGYLEKNMIPVEHSIYDHIVYDSATVERTFAEKMDRNDFVKIYAKLPSWFKIDTPLGSYNPDWALVVEDELDGRDKLYFVLETKGSIDAMDLRGGELAKINCGRKHFEALGATVEFKETDNFDEFILGVEEDLIQEAFEQV